MRGAVVVATLLGSLGASAEPLSRQGYLPLGLPVGGTQSDSVVVTRGDHLWKIAKAHLADTLGDSASNDTVGPYWRSVIAVNRERLRSGDPDLIYPGEVILLPEVSELP